jgi:hypothetical protein
VNIPIARDLTKNAFAQNKITDDLRPYPGAAYPLGTVLQLVPQDSQVYIDALTVQPVPAGRRAKFLIGAVAPEQYPSGFDGSGGQVAALAAARGTQKVTAAIYGQCNVLLDSSGANAANLINGVALESSEVTAGYAEGVSDANHYQQCGLGYAFLPAAGIGSSLVAGALAAATVTFTIATPTAGDTIGVTLQIDYSQAYPGIVQTRTVSILLTAASAVSATTAAVALAAAINADPILSKWYSATNAAGVITVTALATGVIHLFPVSAWSYNNGIPINVFAITFNTAGMLANSLTSVAVVSGGGGTTNVAGAATLAGGTGYKGLCPAFLSPAVGL